MAEETKVNYEKVRIARQLLEESGVHFALSFKDCEGGETTANTNINGNVNDFLNFLEGITSCMSEKCVGNIPQFTLENVCVKAVTDGVRSVYGKN